MLSDFLESAHIVSKSQAVNAYGGTTDTYTDGAKISAGFVLKNGTEVTVAGMDATRAAWTIICGTDVFLRPNDCVRRDATGTVFRVTGVDRVIPRTAEVQFQRFDAEVISC